MIDKNAKRLYKENAVQDVLSAMSGSSDTIYLPFEKYAIIISLVSYLIKNQRRKISRGKITECPFRKRDNYQTQACNYRLKR